MRRSPIRYKTTALYCSKMLMPFKTMKGEKHCQIKVIKKDMTVKFNAWSWIGFGVREGALLLNNTMEVRVHCLQGPRTRSTSCTCADLEATHRIQPPCDEFQAHRGQHRLLPVRLCEPASLPGCGWRRGAMGGRCGGRFYRKQPKLSYPKKFSWYSQPPRNSMK